ncbi:hypothetical protein GWK47_023562 [Chionoecetes opilio]|uniref:Uncharacterized protein n=1 Tax=Chionoecetes opilio TaxID=41210 RepID=A0A8J4XLQ2_CHIOP|nr:hypothetical protein GWK47_023562 [Chionoecetes opilio]
MFEINLALVFDGNLCLFGLPDPPLLDRSELCRLLAPHLTTRILPVNKKVLATLWLLGNQESFRGVGDRFDLSKSSLHKVLLEARDLNQPPMSTLGKKWKVCRSSLPRCSSLYRLQLSIRNVIKIHRRLRRRHGDSRVFNLDRHRVPALRSKITGFFIRLMVSEGLPFVVLPPTVMTLAVSGTSASSVGVAAVSGTSASTTGAVSGPAAVQGKINLSTEEMSNTAVRSALWPLCCSDPTPLQHSLSQRETVLKWGRVRGQRADLTDRDKQKVWAGPEYHIFVTLGRTFPSRLSLPTCPATHPRGDYTLDAASHLPRRPCFHILAFLRRISCSYHSSQLHALIYHFIGGDVHRSFPTWLPDVHRWYPVLCRFSEARFPPSRLYGRRTTTKTSQQSLPHRRTAVRPPYKVKFKSSLPLGGVRSSGVANCAQLSQIPLKR